MTYPHLEPCAEHGKTMCGECMAACLDGRHTTMEFGDGRNAVSELCHGSVRICAHCKVLWWDAKVRASSERRPE